MPSNNVHQLFFDFSDLDNKNKVTDADIFVSSHNQKVFDFLFKYNEEWMSPFVLIVGENYSGKTLLLNSFYNQKENCAVLELSSLKNFDKNCSYYVLDDLQNITKENEEDLFHFLNFVLANKKHLVIASNKAINEINFTTKDVHSRIRSSLVFYIQKPDNNVMKFIFVKMCYNLGFDIAPNIVDYIFKNINTDFKSLGCFANKLYAEKMMVNKKITMSFVKNVIKPKSKFQLMKKLMG